MSMLYSRTNQILDFKFPVLFRKIASKWVAPCVQSGSVAHVKLPSNDVVRIEAKLDS
jgi:hypothetical protein